VEDQEKIFDRFYRVEKSRNSAIAGSGLGLAITKLMVEEFGGSIGVESKIGEGSVFTVILPTKNSSEMR
jgi:signal transduction histidine kinase